MSTQEARNTAAGMMRDALEQLTKWERVQDLRHFDNTKDEATRLLDLAEAALSYFEHHYDFPQDESAKTEVRKLFDPPESYEDQLLTNVGSEASA